MIHMCELMKEIEIPENGMGQGSAGARQCSYLKPGEVGKKRMYGKKNNQQHLP